MIASVETVEYRLLERWVRNAPHGSGATIQGPTIPTIAQLDNTIRAMTDRLAMFTGWTWVAAASVIGFEGIEVLLGSMLAAPEFVPLAILTIALVAVLRDRWRRRAISGLRSRRWIR